MNKSLLYFSILILVSNFLLFLIALTNNIGVLGGYFGGLMAIGTDPVIIFMAIIIGTALVVQQSRFSVIYFILASIVGATIFHFMIGTRMFLVDIVRVNVLLIMLHYMACHTKSYTSVLTVSISHATVRWQNKIVTLEFFYAFNGAKKS